MGGDGLLIPLNPSEKGWRTTTTTSRIFLCVPASAKDPIQEEEESAPPGESYRHLSVTKVKLEWCCVAPRNTS